MMRKSISKFNLSSIRRTIVRGFADKKKSPCSLCPEEAEKNRQNITVETTKKDDDPLCKHHGDLVPDFNDLKNVKKFELKSDCNKFHWTSQGH